MAAVSPLLLLLTTLAPNSDPLAPYTSPPFWNDTDASEGLSRCAPFLPVEGDRGGCPLHEHYERCGDICVRSCVEYECPLRCCVEGCFCDEGLVRGPRGTCVPQDTCPTPLFHRTNRIDESPSCGPDEYISCDSDCERNCTNYHDVIFCEKECVLDCVCVPPKIRGPRGDCVLPQQCDSPPKVSEVMAEGEIKRCPPGEMHSCDSPCERTCDNWRDEERSCPDDDECHSGCICLPPKVRGPSGGCIHPKECPTTTETLLEEHMRMAAMICNFVRIMGNPPAWSDSCPMIVHECTDPAECLEASPPLLSQFSVCREDERLNLIPSCPATCATYRNPSEGCQLTDRVVPRCDCKQGWVRDPHGACVLPENCPGEEVTTECNDPNGCDQQSSTPSTLGVGRFCYSTEYWNWVPSCPPTCHNYWTKYQGCRHTPVPRCDCRYGNVKDAEGRCIDPELCPGHEVRKCKEHEEWRTCGSGCAKSCENPEASCPGECVKGCFCKEPRIRGPSGTCVLKAECPPKPTDCPENEEWKTCGSACPKTCDNYDVDVPCIAVCKKGCFCQEPRVRGPNGTCVLKEECPPRPADPCPRIKCEEGCYYDTNSTSCPVCVCPSRSAPVCPQILCRKGYFLDAKALPCPKCVQCPMVRCMDGCQLDSTQEPCPTCVCTNAAPGGGGDILPVPPGCRFDAIDDQATCRRRDNWEQRAVEKCLQRDMKLVNTAMLQPCGSSIFRGIQFVCCPKDEEQKTCYGQAQSGPCLEKIPAWRYDSNYERCTSFIYSGCGGNGNRYASERQCMNFCRGCVVVDCPPDCRPDPTQIPCPTSCICDKEPEPEPEPEDDSQFLPVPTGCRFDALDDRTNCRSYDYWTQAAARTCRERDMLLRNSSMLLPCSGKNLFQGVQLVCCPRDVDQKTCAAEPDRGQCKGYFPTWYYDWRIRRCRQFVYGGCEGNGNRYATENECMEYCQGCVVAECPYNCRLNMSQGRCPTSCICDKGEERSLSLSACPENERYRSCGTRCPKTCSNWDEPPGLCPLVCIPGCFCKEPLVRGPGGKCVHPRECPQLPAGMTTDDDALLYHSCRNVECKEGWYLDPQSVPCPKCRECPLINCRRGCYLDRLNKPCPRCICYDNPQGDNPS